MSQRPKAPCYQCNDRVLGCHGICKRYKDFKEEIAERNAMVKQYLHPFVDRYFKDNCKTPETARYSKKRYRQVIKMNEWWKSPVLQGPENDYGQYDYMIEEIPKDYARWEFDRKYKWACHNCGRESHLRFCSAHHFHTMDGWDSLDYAECWHCWLKGIIRSYKWKIKKGFKKRIETFKMTMELYDIGSKSFSDCYKLAKKIVK